MSLGEKTGYFQKETAIRLFYLGYRATFYHIDNISIYKDTADLKNFAWRKKARLLQRLRTR